MKHILASFLAIFVLSHHSSAQDLPADSIPLGNLHLPDGYIIEVFASGLANAREMDFAEDGTLFVGSLEAGKVYAITKDRQVMVVDEGLDMPAGVDYHDGDLYIAGVSRILRYNNILENLESNPTPVILNANFPKDQWQAWKFIRIGPDDKIYIPVSASCNSCLPDSLWHARILRMSLDGSTLEIFASGVRSCKGLDWDPVTDILWFTDNGRDDLGEDFPPDELNKAFVDSEHFGFPFFNGTLRDPESWPYRPKKTGFINPKYALPAHCGAQGMRFYTGKMFEEKYLNGIFIAEHGSESQDKPSGFQVSFIPVEDGLPTGYEIFCSGWLAGETPWGRPADVEVGPDGSLFISDDMEGCVYRIYRE